MINVKGVKSPFLIDFAEFDFQHWPVKWPDTWPINRFWDCLNENDKGKSGAERVAIAQQNANYLSWCHDW